MLPTSLMFRCSHVNMEKVRYCIASTKQVVLRGSFNVSYIEIMDRH